MFREHLKIINKQFNLKIDPQTVTLSLAVTPRQLPSPWGWPPDSNPLPGGDPQTVTLSLGVTPRQLPFPWGWPPDSNPLPGSAGCGGRGGEAGPPAGGQAGRPGAHVHQHQQRTVHPPGGLHTGGARRQLLRVPAQTVDPGWQEGAPVRPCLVLTLTLPLPVIYSSVLLYC